jgi:hypothetical protein
MMATRIYSLGILSSDGAQESQLAAALRRVEETVDLIAENEPADALALAAVLRKAEITIKDVNMPELEFAAYLAGIARGLS